MARAESRSVRVAESLREFGGGSNVDAYLDALGPAGDEAGRVVDVYLHDIGDSPWQPRVHYEVRAMNDLVESIRANGVLHPVTVRVSATGGAGAPRYEVVAGHRRLAALRHLAQERGDVEIATAPVRVMALDDVRARLLTHTENLAREDLSPWERARSVDNVRVALAEAGCPHDVHAVGQRVQLAAGPTSEYLRIAAVVTRELIVAAAGTAQLTPADLAKVHRLRKAELLAIVGAPPDNRVSLVQRIFGKTRDANVRRPPRSPRGAGKTGGEGDGNRPPRYTVEQLRHGGGFAINLTKPFTQYAPREAHAFLQDILPAVVALSESAFGEQCSMVSHTGPGVVLYLRTKGAVDIGAPVQAALATLLEAIKSATPPSN